MVWLKRPPRLYLLALALLALTLRLMIGAVPPLLVYIQKETQISPSVAGFTTALPVICFGVFAFIAPRIARKLGTNPTLALAVVLMAIGTTVRFVPSLVSLFAGTIIMGMGVAIANVIIVVAIRENYAHRIRFMVSSYSALIDTGAAAGSAFVIPLMQLLGNRWNLSLGIWVVPLVALLLIWLKATKNEDKPQMIGSDKQISYFRLLREKTVMLLTAIMGVQGALYFGLLTWIPQQLQAQGVPLSRAGFLLAFFSGLGFFGSIAGPLVVKTRYPRVTTAAAISTYMCGLLLMTLGFHLVGVIILGFNQGMAFSAGLTLIADLPDSTKVSRVSATAQGFGYLVSAVVPIGLGWLKQVSGGWTVPLIAEFVLMLVLIGIFMAAISSVESDRRVI